MDRLRIPFCVALLLTGGREILALTSRNTTEDYTNRPRTDVPAEWRWRLEDLFASPERWHAELAALQVDVKAWARRSESWTDSAGALAKLLEDEDELQKRCGRLAAFATLSSQTAWSNATFQDMSSQADLLVRELDSQSARLKGRLAALGATGLDGLLAAEKRLAPYTVTLKENLRDAAHRPSPELEPVLSDLQVFSREFKTAADMLWQRDMPPGTVQLGDGRELTLDRSTAELLAHSPRADERKARAVAQSRRLRTYENTFAALLDASTRRDAFLARQRKYPTSLTAELDPYGVSEAVYRSLVTQVGSRLAPYHRYLELRKKVLGLPELHPYDSFLTLVPNIPLNWSYSEACGLLQKATAPLGPEYANVLQRCFADHWVDAFGHQDKMNMGSAQFVPGFHPFVSLNYHGSFFDLITVGHEIGHAISFELPRQAQPYPNSVGSWFVSEVPSTCNEILLMDLLVRETPDDHRKALLLSEYIDRLNVLIFQCALGAEMQLAQHEHVEAGGTLSPAWLNGKQLELKRRYLGHGQGVMVVDDFEEVGWNHANTFFAPFQDYFYVVGAVVSLAVVEAIEREGEPAAQRYLSFLKAGGSRSVVDLLSDLGVDLTTPEPYDRAMRKLDSLVADLDAVLKRLANNGGG